MTNKSWRIRSCLAIFNTLGVFIVLAGCRQCADSPPVTHLSHGRPSCGNGWCAECGPCSGFHPTVWQSWQEGAMAARCSEGEPARPAGSELFPELVPTPAAQGSGKPATPDLPAPSRSEAPPGKAAENVGPQIPSPDKQPVPARKEPAPAQEKPADKPADPVPPLMLDHSTGPITAAPGRQCPTRPEGTRRSRPKRFPPVSSPTANCRRHLLWIPASRTTTAARTWRTRCGGNAILWLFRF